MHLFKELGLIKANTKGKFFLFFFRISSFFLRNKALRIIGLPVRALYAFLIQWVMGIDIFDATRIGVGFNVYHGQGLVVNKKAVIGDFVTVRHNTTIGNARKNGGSPVIGNHVDIGANVVIIGEIKIGDNAVIAAGSVVIKDVPPNTIVAGNPAKVVKVLSL